MSFDARITFTGVCTFVPNKDKTRYYVLLPNGEQQLGDSDSIDGTIWRRHRGFLRFDVRDLAYAHGLWGIGKGISGIQYFQRSLEEGGVEKETGTELFLQTSGVSGPLKVEAVALANLSNIAPDYSTIDSDLVTKKGAQIPKTISMRMLLDRGTLKSGNNSATWRFPNTLTELLPDSAVLASQVLVHEVVLELKDLSSLKFIASSIPGGNTQILDLAAASGEVVEVTIANFCDDNPLQWKKDEVLQQPDVDFKWHFRLLEETVRKDLTNLLGGLELPFPLPIDRNGSGANCYPAQAQTDGDF